MRVLSSLKRTEAVRDINKTVKSFRLGEKHNWTTYNTFLLHVYNFGDSMFHSLDIIEFKRMI